MKKPSVIFSFIQRHSLVIGIIFMFALTWPIDLSNSGVLPFKLPFVVYILLGYGFVIAALIMTALTLGKDGTVSLLKRFLIWRVGWKWYLVAFLLLPVIQSLAVLLNTWYAHTTVDFSNVFAYKIFGLSANLPILILPFFIFEAITNGEEIGWRGYVLPRLQAKYSALVSSAILGVIWGFWHLPKFLAPENNSSFPLFMVKIVTEAVLYTWLYNNTKGSLLLATMFHAAGNTSGMFLPIANTVTGSNLNTLIIQIMLEVLVAIGVILIAGPEKLSRTAPKQVQVYKDKAQKPRPPDWQDSPIGML